MAERSFDEKRGPRPGSPSWYDSISTLTPWGYVTAGLVIVVIGVVCVAAGATTAVSDIEAATTEGAEQGLGPLIMQAVGYTLAAIGGVLALVGAVAEGVRVGTLYARHQ